MIRQLKLPVVATGILLAGFAWSASPVRVGVFTGDGSGGFGMARWVQLANTSDDLVASYVDGASIRTGALDRIDVLVVPGGCHGRAYDDIGTNGSEKVRAFIRVGGGYIGTSEGCFIALQPTKSHPNRIGLVPFVSQPGPCRHGSILSTKFLPAASALGLKPGNRRVRYHGGPLMVPGEPVEDAKFEVMARFAGDLNPGSPAPAAPMSGTASVVAGTYGKGRVVAFADHPEYYPETLDIVRGAFKCVTGRTVQWKIPQRTRGAFSVGYLCDESFGVKGAATLAVVLKSGVADVTLLTNDQCAEGALRHLDALVIPDFPLTPKALRNLVYSSEARARYAEFTTRGGRIVTWGESARLYPEDRRLVSSVEPGQVVATLKRLADEAPSPAPTLAPAKVAIYAGPGVSCPEYWNVAKLIEFSPNYTATFVDGGDIAAGGLQKDRYDLLLMGGGGSPTQFKVLGTAGHQAVHDFVRAGGSYYGICAGAFLALQDQGRRNGIGLVPYKAQKGPPCRGWADISVEFTDFANETLGFMGGTRRFVLYWCGPVILPGDPIPDADVRPLVNYYGNTVNTFAGGKSAPMGGHAAVVGGRVGKGRVIASGPHPEGSEATQDIVRAFLRYLTGRSADPAYPNRVRGAVNVAFCVESATKSGMAFGMKLMHDPRFDVQPVTPYCVELGLLDHTDVLFFPWPVTGGYMGLVHEFIAKGGKVVELDPNGKSRTKGERIFHVKSFDEAIEKMLK